MGVTPIMSNQDDVKGRVKEALGDLKDDKDLKREGKVDRAAGAAKDKIDKAANKAKGALRSH
ncbi:MAG TPA: CsbD family protein [Gaiellaceae bacterium]